MVARLKRVGAVARVETLMMLRDRAHLALIFLLPIFQILLYGYAISLEPKHVTLAIATDEPRLVAQAIDAINQTPMLTLLKPVGPAGSADKAVKAGRAQVGIEVGRDPETRAVAVQIIADPGDPAEVRPAIGVLQMGLWKNVAEVYAQDQGAYGDHDLAAQRQGRQRLDDRAGPDRHDRHGHHAVPGRPDPGARARAG